MDTICVPPIFSFHPSLLNQGRQGQRRGHTLPSWYIFYSTWSGMIKHLPRQVSLVIVASSGFCFSSFWAGNPISASWTDCSGACWPLGFGEAQAAMRCYFDGCSMLDMQVIGYNFLCCQLLWCSSHHHAWKLWLQAATGSWDKKQILTAMMSSVLRRQWGWLCVGQNLCSASTYRTCPGVNPVSWFRLG